MAVTCIECRNYVESPGIAITYVKNNKRIIGYVVCEKHIQNEKVINCIDNFSPIGKDHVALDIVVGETYNNILARADKLEIKRYGGTMSLKKLKKYFPIICEFLIKKVREENFN